MRAFSSWSPSRLPGHAPCGQSPARFAAGIGAWLAPWIAAVTIGLVGCAGTTEPHAPPQQLTALPRDLSVAEQKVVAGSNAFSIALWQKVAAAQRDTSVFISPLSASFALGMTMNGAANATWSEMRDALQFGGATQQEINSGYKSLVALLTSLDPQVTMQLANSIWYRQTFPFLQSFLDTTKAVFDADVKGLDFTNVPASLATINGWVDAKTAHRIPTVLENITSDQVMFLINAIYFKGGWRNKFDVGKTTDDTFHGAGGTTQPVRLMHSLRDSTSYAETATYQAVDLPYGNGAFSMTVLLPRAGTDVETLSASLTPAAWSAVVAGFHPAKIDLALPRFTLKWERKLNADLEALGMRQAFVLDGADFTRMAAAPIGLHLYVQFVKQNTFVAVDEEGTEAAAVTVVGIGVTSLPVIPVVRVDRPFLFVLRERLTGTILFMGKIVRMPT